MHIISVQYDVPNWVYFFFFFNISTQEGEVWIRTSDIRFIRRGNKTKQNIEARTHPNKDSSTIIVQNKT
jgi:hypothetical protein